MPKLSENICFTAVCVLTPIAPASESCRPVSELIMKSVLPQPCEPATLSCRVGPYVGPYDPTKGGWDPAGGVGPYTNDSSPPYTYTARTAVHRTAVRSDIVDLQLYNHDNTHLKIDSDDGMMGFIASSLIGDAFATAHTCPTKTPL